MDRTMDQDIDSIVDMDASEQRRDKGELIDPYLDKIYR